MGHEDFSRDQDVEGSSDRAFGLVFAGVLLVISGWPLIHGGMPRWWALGVGAILAVIAVAKPLLLAAANRQWTRFGILLGNVVGPVAAGILFYVVFTPIAIAMRLAGNDPLRLKLDHDADSYWILRKPPGPPPDSLTNQF